MISDAENYEPSGAWWHEREPYAEKLRRMSRRPKWWPHEYHALITPHFVLGEFACKCRCKVPDDVWSNVSWLCDNLETLRELTQKPIKIVSGYRCKAHNKKVGGAPRSRHLTGEGCDLQIRGFDGQFLQGMVWGLMLKGDMAKGGVGSYRSKPRTLHYDIRGKLKEWRYD